MFLKWVTIKKLAELTGYTEDAIRAKIKKHVWVKGRFWKHAPDGRVVCNWSEVELWMGS